MSKFIKNLKSYFVVEEGGKSQPTSPPTSPKTEPVQKQASKSNHTIIPTTMTKGQVDEKFMNVLLQALEKANQEGYDYWEFMNAIKSLEKMNMDEATRFKSAYTLAQTMGVTPTKLEQSAKYYMDVLKQEESKFQNALQHQQNTNINQRKQSVTDNEKAIVDKKAQIKKLETEIANHQKQIEKLQAEVKGAKTKVSNANANFAASYQLLVNKIQSDIDKMRQYLK